MDELTTLQKALLTIKKLKNRLDEQMHKSFEPIAIIGMSSRYPGANNLQEYWELLKTGQNIISSLPEERWELLKNSKELYLREHADKINGGFLKNIAEFDAYFFRISPREAIRMDPQQRLLLEVTYEAMEDAGLSVEKLAGSNTGVFASLYASQYAALQQLKNDRDALYLPTGNAVSIAANRLSFLFDLQGPSLVLDTACSSSLVGLHLACLNLQTKLCDLAIVAAANINLLPSYNTILTKAKMLSPDGQCKTFDANANGYVQGEGVNAIILKPLSQALKDQDRIYAVIAGSAVNQDGKTNGLTAPNGLQQEKVLSKAYKVANIDPNDLSYIECHGTGTFLGDPIEVEALGNVISKTRQSNQPCWIGSVKTNIGHLEPAAGLASVIKVALALRHAQIPKHLNFSTPNPHIPFEKYHFQIPPTLLDWPKYGKYRLAGISSFGFGGTNAHIVMRDVTSIEMGTSEGLQTNGAENNELFTLSAKDLPALKLLINNWCAFLAKNDSLNFSQVCYNVHIHRSHYPIRIAIIAKNINELSAALLQLQNDINVQAKNIFISDSKSNHTTIDIAPVDLKNIDLAELARLYVNKVTINWAKFEETRRFPMIDMPLYPWQHKIYWSTQEENQISEISDYPLQGKFIDSPLKTFQFEFFFDTKKLPEIKDSFHFLHAGYYLEMLAFAVKQFYQKSNFKAEEVTFLSPLIVLPDSELKVELILEKTENDALSFHFYSNPDNQNWIEHAKGKLSIKTLLIKKVDSIDDIKKRCTYTGSADDFYHRITEMGMPAGDTIRWTQKYWQNETEILCEFREPKPEENSEQFCLKVHPGIIDGCVQSLFMLLPKDIIKPYVAASIGKITYFNKPTAHMYLLTHVKEIQKNGEKIIGDWYLLDDDNQLIAQCESLTMQQLNNKLQIEHIVKIRSSGIIDPSLPASERKEKMIQYLVEQIAAIFSMPSEDIDIHQSLSNIGLDSLMALAVMRVIETGLGVNYSIQQIMQGPSIYEIAEYVLSQKPLTSSSECKVRKMSQKNRWVAFRQPKVDAQMRLFCLPYGGGGASIYRDWQKDLPDSIEVCPIQLPGRENRLDEKPINNVNTLVNLLAENIQSEFDIPFAFFGHSFGSLIAFELVRYLRKHKLPMPIHLFVSAYPDPKLPAPNLDNLIAKLKSVNLNLFDLNEKSIDSLNDEQLNLLIMIFNKNGLVDVNGEKINKNVLKALLPIFIGDMNLVKSYQYIAEPPLDLPITVFLGKKDAWVSYEDHLGWADQTQKGCVIHTFESGHLFINDINYRKEILQTMSKVLNKHLSFTHVA